MTLLLNWRVWFAVGLAVSFALMSRPGKDGQARPAWGARRVERPSQLRLSYPQIR